MSSHIDPDLLELLAEKRASTRVDLVHAKPGRFSAEAYRPLLHREHGGIKVPLWSAKCPGNRERASCDFTVSARVDDMLFELN